MKNKCKCTWELFEEIQAKTLQKFLVVNTGDFAESWWEMMICSLYKER